LINAFSQAEIEGPTGTPYETKYFQLKLLLSPEFPATPPRGFFTTKIYHPNVDMSTGAICVNTLKKDWTSETTFAHVLSVIRCLLIIPFPESSLNDEAGKLFMESYDEYAKRARLMAGVHGRTYDDDDQSEENASVKKKPLHRSTSSLEAQKSLRDVNRSNMKVEAEKKSKKKSLKRL
jgi:ubiquitin-conjugating enzyme E2 S